MAAALGSDISHAKWALQARGVAGEDDTANMVFTHMQIDKQRLVNFHSQYQHIEIWQINQESEESFHGNEMGKLSYDFVMYTVTIYVNTVMSILFIYSPIPFCCGLGWVVSRFVFPRAIRARALYPALSCYTRTHYPKESGGVPFYNTHTHAYVCTTSSDFVLFRLI